MRGGRVGGGGGAGPGGWRRRWPLLVDTRTMLLIEFPHVPLGVLLTVFGEVAILDISSECPD